MKKILYVPPAIGMFMAAQVGPNGNSGDNPHDDAEPQGVGNNDTNAKWGNIWEEFE